MSSAFNAIRTITGTANQIDRTAGNNPVISISATYAGQNSITTLGTITTGVWNASLIPLAYGGTNANITPVANSLVYSDAAKLTLLATANNGVLVTSAGGVPSISSTLPLAVQNNITELTTVTMSGFLTLNADPLTSLQAATKQYVDSVATGLEIKASVFAASTAALTVVYDNGVAGVGATLTNAAAQATFSLDGLNPPLNSRVLIKDQAGALQNGIYVVTDVGSGATNWVLTRATDFDQPVEIPAGALAIVDACGTANGATSWIQTATVAAVGVDDILFSRFTYGSIIPVTGGGTGLTTITNHGVMLGQGTSNVAATVLGAGEVLIGTTAADPTAATLTAGTGIGITSASGSITINSTGGGMAIVDQNSNTATLATGTTYICNNGGTLITFTLPAVAALGEVFEIVGGSSGGWTIAQNAGQTLRVGNQSTTAGAGGTLSSSNLNDCVRIRCVVANTDFVITNSFGNLTIV